MPPARTWSRKFKEGSENRYNSSYIGGRTGLEYAGVDLHIGAIESMDSPALNVACPARNWSENLR
jgi:hypothetical protein